MNYNTLDDKQKALLIGQRIKERREELGLTQEHLGAKLGLDKSTIQRYETGQVKKIKIPILQVMAKELAVHPNWLALKTDDKLYIVSEPTPNSPTITEDTTTFPVIGDIAAGFDKIALENWEGDTVEVPNSYLKGRDKNEFMVLRVKGDSMYPLYHEGDKVLILKQSTLNASGDIGAILYDDELITLKKVEYVMGEDWLRMVPINPNVPPTKIEGERLEHCRIIGIPKLLIRELNEQ